MKLTVKRSKIVASLSDEGRDGFEAEVTLRVSGGQILPTITFSPGVSASDVRRVVKTLGATQIAPSGCRPFLLHQPAPQDVAAEPDGLRRPRRLQALRKIGILGTRR